MSQDYYERRAYTPQEHFDYQVIKNIAEMVREFHENLSDDEKRILSDTTKKVNDLKKLQKRIMIQFWIASGMVAALVTYLMVKLFMPDLL